MVPTSSSPNGHTPVDGRVGAGSSDVPSELPFSATSMVDHRIALREGDAVSGLSRG